MLIQDFHQALFQLPTKHFGDTGAEILRRHYHMSPAPKGITLYDALADGPEPHVEIKCASVRAKGGSSKNKSPYYNLYRALRRVQLVPFSKWTSHKFEVTINQVKAYACDALYYALFFMESIVVFSIPSNEIDDRVGYCDGQHLGNTGEGTFQITQRNLPFHLQNYYRETFDYAYAMDVLGPDPFAVSPDFTVDARKPPRGVYMGRPGLISLLKAPSDRVTG